MAELVGLRDRVILHPINYDNDNVSYEASRKTLDEVVYEKAHTLMYRCVDTTLEYFLFQDLCEHFDRIML